MSVTQSLEARFADAVGAFGDLGTPVVLAVSGGSDSTALMHLAAKILPAAKLLIVTVNHGLRADAAREIEQVAAQAKSLGILHETKQWTWDGQSNLQAAARTGRWHLLRDMAKAKTATWVWMGHTQDDQIETALMRLARGSGVDGLTGMHLQARRDGLRIGRPLLGLTRAELREWLSAQDISWSDDPSNEDTRFDRVKTRQMMAQLQTLGLTKKRLLQTIDHMQAAQVSLQNAAHDFAATHVRQDAGDLLLTPDVLDIDKADAPRRVFATALGWIAGRTYRPRFEQLRDVAQQARNGRTVTLGGVVISPAADGSTRLTREAAATEAVVVQIPDTSPPRGATWDKRWYLEGPVKSGFMLRALGEGIRECPDWRHAGLPRTSLLASPSVWDGEVLVAAPLARLSNGWSARIAADFHSTAFAIED